MWVLLLVWLFFITQWLNKTVHQSLINCMRERVILWIPTVRFKRKSVPWHFGLTVITHDWRWLQSMPINTHTVHTAYCVQSIMNAGIRTLCRADRHTKTHSVTKLSPDWLPWMPLSCIIYFECLTCFWWWWKFPDHFSQLSKILTQGFFFICFGICWRGNGFSDDLCCLFSKIMLSKIVIATCRYKTCEIFVRSKPWAMIKRGLGVLWVHRVNRS